MKLLVDQNLSHKLPDQLQDLFPGSIHVMFLDLDRADDQEIWVFAKKNHFAILTKDSDYNDLNLLHGFPPKVILLKIGNCRVPDIVQKIRNHFQALIEFFGNSEAGIIELF